MNNGPKTYLAGGIFRISSYRHSFHHQVWPK